MRRVTIIAVILILAAATGAFAASGSFAVGGEGALYVGGVGGMPAGAMLTVRLPVAPFMFGVGVTDSMLIGLTVDYWAARGPLAGVFDWYAGVGGYVSLGLGSGSLAMGGRIPVGLQAWVLGRSLELFVEAAPAVGLRLVPTGFDWHLQAAFGARFWF